MYGRYVKIFVVDEFVATAISGLLQAELENLKADMAVERDQANNIGWARLKIEHSNLHGLLQRLNFDLRELGPTPPDILAMLERDVERWACEMPRSKANSEVYRARKAKEAELRALVRQRRQEYREAKKAARKM